MEQKALLFGDTAIAQQIMATDDPQVMQKLGQQAAGFDPIIWDGHKQLIVYQATLAKFEQNYELRKLLLDTGDARLAECALKDKTWGIGMHADTFGVDDPQNWTGKNLLGFTLEAVRSVLRNQ